MHVMMKYLSEFDGQKKWEEIEPTVEATFHDDLVVVDGKEEYDREQFTAKLKDFVQEGGYMEIMSVKVAPYPYTNDNIRYEIHFHHPQRPVNQTKTLACFQDGKLIRVQRDNIRVTHQIL